MSYLEIEEGEGAIVATYYLKHEPNSLPFMAGFIKKAPSDLNPNNQYFINYTRASAPNHRKAKLEEFEVYAFKKAIDQLPENISRVYFKIVNMSLKEEYYLPLEQVKKASVNNYRYALTIGDLMKQKPEPPKSLLKTEERVKIQKKNKAREKALRDNEEYKYSSLFSTKKKIGVIGISEINPAMRKILKRKR